MSEKNGSIWLAEYFENPSIVGLNFQGPEGHHEIGLTREGVEATIELLAEWLDYNEERMEELFGDLNSFGVSDE